jgi:hypothetical protein
VEGNGEQAYAVRRSDPRRANDPAKPFARDAEGKRFQTVATAVDAGPVYTTAEFGGGFSGYPIDGLPFWELPEDTLTDVDTAALVSHFIANWGKAYSFTFTNEAGTPFTKAHYSSDVLTVTYRGVNDSSVQVLIETTN